MELFLLTEKKNLIFEKKKSLITEQVMYLH